MSAPEYSLPEKVLCVDSDPAVLEFYKNYLGRRFNVSTASDADDALLKMDREGPYAVLMVDMIMPEMDGAELLAEAQKIAPETVRIMLTADSEKTNGMDAASRDRIFQFLNKPCPPAILASALEAGIKQYRLIVAERELLEKTLNGAIKVLADVITSLDPKAFGEAQQMKEYMRLMVEWINPARRWEFDIAATLYRIGHVTIPSTILQKARSGLALTAVERSLLNRAPEFGCKLLSDIPRLETVSRVIYYQNKNFDGTGFPNDATAGDQIPLGGRILKILSDLIHHQSEGAAKLQALEIMAEAKGCYDPRLLAIARKCLLHDGPKGGQPITLKELAIGHVLAAPVETPDGMLIVAADSRISHVLLEKLQNFTQLSGIREPIYVQNREGAAQAEPSPGKA
jgi:response regulator RpfG family c-di-GMP phosphodiesterase